MRGKNGDANNQGNNAGTFGNTFVGEFLCTTCERGGDQREASNYCMECYSNLCPDCVAQHKKFPTMRSHKILGKSARRYLDKEVREEENLLECHNHPGKMVDMYCSEHADVWCGGCMATYHRSCSGVVFITEASKNVLKTKDYKEAKTSIKKMTKEYSQLLQRVDKNISALAEQHDAVLATVKDFRTRVNLMLDELETLTVDHLKQIYARNSVQISEDRLKCEAFLKAMRQLDRELDKPLSPTNSESDIFTYIQRAKKVLNEGTCSYSQIHRGTLGKRLHFVIDPSLEEFLQRMRERRLGEFIYKYRITEINVLLDDDADTCVLNGASVVKDERILIADWANKRLKLLDKFFTVIDKLDLETGPNDVCHISTNEAMVSLPEDKALQVVKLDPKLALGKKYDVGIECRGMEYWAGELYTICGGLEHEAPGHIRVYNTNAKLIRSIEHDHLGKSILSIPMRIAMSNDGTRLYVTDGEKGVITLKRSGEVLPIFEDSSLKWPWGICVDNNDQLFVCGSSSNNVIQVRDNRKISTVLTPDDGLKDPMCILYFPLGSRLIVTTNKSEYIKVFTPM